MKTSRLHHKGRAAFRTLVAAPALLAPLEDELVVYSSFDGRYDDHPRALYEARSDHPAVWVSTDSALISSRRVRPQTVAHRATLNRAGCVVTNSPLPDHYRKRSGAKVIQTWHGTPLKRIGFDIAELNFDGKYSHYLDTLAHDVSHWDVLLSTSPFTTSILRSAFRYEGVIIEAGSPRNDRLLTSTDCDVRQARARMGIGNDEKVLLYAPTFRDDGHDTVIDEAIQQLVAQLPLDWRLLSRLHPSRHSRPRALNPRVIDGNTVDDVADLFLVSDALVTDYSSVMFDYLLTGKPIYLYCPDLARYQSVNRGLYLDIEAEAPGLLVTRLADLVDAVVSNTQDAAKSKAMRARFAPWDDGLASRRVVERVWASHDGA